MDIRPFKLILHAAAALLAGSCAVTETKMHGAVFQLLEFGNDGQGEVHAAKVQYGAYVVPSGTSSSAIKPSHIAGSSEFLTIPIPESTDVSWISADGNQHQAVVPTRSFVNNPACFHGFRFFFVDDHVDVYVLNRIGDCRQMQGVERTKVFSSKHSRAE